MVDLSSIATQATLGKIVGISQQTASDLLARGVLTPGATLGQWLIEYCSHLREIAAGRATDGSIDLPTERARLAKAQREGQEIKNDVARGAYAPIEALSDVLANASQSVVDHLDQIPAGISRVCPDLPQSVRDLMMSEIARARNEMVRKTISLMADKLDATDIQEEDKENPSQDHEALDI
jgi:phage terminase Nu1 subunit (DNA packaging protein)